MSPPGICNKNGSDDYRCEREILQETPCMALMQLMAAALGAHAATHHMTAVGKLLPVIPVISVP
jgi:hypothetical protein